MKKIILFIACALAFASCVKEEMTGSEPSNELMVKTVYLDATVTKTQIMGDNDVYWTQGDKLDVYVNHKYFPGSNSQKDGMYKVFTNSSSSPSASTTFRCVDWPEDVSNYMPNAFAFYPSGMVSYGLKRQGGTNDNRFDPGIYFTLPEVQEAVDGSFDPSANLSYAIFNVSDVNDGKADIMFKNMCSLIKITLPQGSDDVKSINISSPNGVKMAGKLQLYASGALNDGYYYYNNLSYSNNQIPTYSYVRLSKSNGECLKSGETYYAVILSSGNFVTGMSKIHDKIEILFTNKDGYEIKKTVNLSSIGWEPKPSKLISIKVSSLNFSPNPTLELNGDTNLVIYPNGSNEPSIGVQSSDSWTIDYDTKPSWVNVLEVGGNQLVITAAPNNTKSFRNGTITIISGDLRKDVAVSQDVMIYNTVDGTAVQQADQLENGALYIIANKSTNKFMTVEQNQVSFESLSTQTNSDLYGVYVFEYIRDDSKKQTFDTQYRYNSGGTLRALSLDRYLDSYARFSGASKESAQYLSIANCWGNDAPGDMDVYRAGSEYSLWHDNGTVTFGDKGFASDVNQRKWIFYQVKIKQN